MRDQGEQTGGDEGQSLVTVLRLVSQRHVWKDLCSLAYKLSGHMWLPPGPVFLTSVEPPGSVPTLSPWFGWRALILLGKLVWGRGEGLESRGQVSFPGAALWSSDCGTWAAPPLLQVSLVVQQASLGLFPWGVAEACQAS